MHRPSPSRLPPARRRSTSWPAEPREGVMDRTRTTKWLVLAAAVPTLWLADISPQVPHGLTLVRHAHAIVGAPLTPVSVAGVARRTTRRVVVAESEATAAAVNTTAQQ